MAGEAFKAWHAEFARSGVIRPVKLGMSRHQLEQLFGLPDDMGGVSRTRKQPSIWLYDGLEFHFAASGDDRLCLIFRDDENGVVMTSFADDHI
ncbi:hypothetical protein J2T09_003073 [Neorhizobium huautlense]|uniref:Uncharacterized protein n=1 Tax=Neorhizobium huautlense TaxID=67774 RepID=A0ABT9PV12_9HYPH|nr:hypothetical protein [Neorhizobium huautlense]MDP9838306.1 hypothetical protein [Neorhizobium huautlense]